jgi:hypothetical protein
MIRVCCFCDKIHDEAIGVWQHQRRHASAYVSEGSVILSYTCCRQCLDADPRANVFRARQSQSCGSQQLIFSRAAS